MKATKKPVPIIPKTVTINVESDQVAAVAHEDCLLILSVTRIAWLSKDGEERDRQLCRTLAAAIAGAEDMETEETDEHEIIPFGGEWWPLPKPEH